MLTNLYISDVLSKVSPNFQGVYSSDTIPVKKLRRLKNFCIVVNLSKINQPGTHFVAVLKLGSKAVIYFDPYGLPCFVQDICKFMKSLKVPIVDKKIKLQHDQSVYCGFFTILFCIVHQKIYQLHWESDPEKLMENDKKVVSYICKSLKH